MTIAVCQN